MDKTVIFDMDGVLTDSEPAITRASMEALAEFGIEAEFGDFRQFAGMGDDIYIGGVARLHGGEYDVAMKKRAYEIYQQRTERINVFPWSKNVVETLHNMGYKTAVASASDVDKVFCNIRCIGVKDGSFDAVVTGSDVQRKKPAPDIFLKAAEKVGADPKKCIVAEDAVSGVMAAKAAGMTAVAVTTTFPADKLKEAGADYIVDDLMKLVEIAESLNL